MGSIGKIKGKINPPVKSTKEMRGIFDVTASPTRKALGGTAGIAGAAGVTSATADQISDGDE